MAKSKRKSREGQMRKLIARYEQQGLSQAAFCRQHCIALNTFRYWLRKYRAERANPEVTERFVALEFTGSLPGARTGPELCYRDGTRLQFSSGTDAAYIRHFIPEFQS